MDKLIKDCCSCNSTQPESIVNIVSGNDFYLSVQLSKYNSSTSTWESYDMNECEDVDLYIFTQNDVRTHLITDITISGKVEAKVESTDVECRTYGIGISWKENGVDKNVRQSNMFNVYDSGSNSIPTINTYDFNVQIEDGVAYISMGQVPGDLINRTEFENTLSSYVNYDYLNSQSYVSTNELATILENASYATIDYVDTAIGNIPQPDLSSYVTYDYLNSQSYVQYDKDFSDELVIPANSLYEPNSNFILTMDGGSLSMNELGANTIWNIPYQDEYENGKTVAFSEDIVNDYVSKTSLNTMSYATTNYVDNSISGLATTQYVDESLSSYATIQYVDDAISHIDPDMPDLSAYVTHDFLSSQSYTTSSDLSVYGKSLALNSHYVDSRGQLSQGIELKNENQRLSFVVIDSNYVSKINDQWTTSLQTSSTITPSQLIKIYQDSDRIDANESYITSLDSRVTTLEESGSVDLSSYVDYDQFDNSNEAIAYELTSNRLAHIDINNNFGNYYTKNESDGKYITGSTLNNYVTVVQNEDQNQTIAYAISYLNDNIGGGSDIDLSSYATYDYVDSTFVTYAYLDDVISNIPSGGGSGISYEYLASTYYSKEEIDNQQLATSYVLDALLTSYVSYDFLSSQSYITSSELNNAGYITSSDINNAGYITSSELNNAGYITSSELNNAGYITSSELNNAGYITSSDLSANSYVSSSYISNIWVGTQSEYDNISTPNNNILYLIK